MSSEHSKAASHMQRRFNPYFKKWGFFINGRVYSKVYDSGLTALATIELEGTHLAGKFNIEMSIFVPEVHKYLTKFPIRGRLTNINCCIRQRFSDHLFGYGANWWRINSDTEFVNSIMGDFEIHGLEFFNRFSTRKQIFDEGSGNPAKIIAAMICLGRGDRATASRLLFEQAAQTEHDGHRDYVLELAKEHQLLPNLSSTDFNTTVMQ
jgi:hypothetical protein